MSSRRSKLFNYLRFCFFANLVLFLSVLSFWIWLRSSRSELVSVVNRQLAYNLKLSSDLALANDILTNRYFNAASFFVSNIVSGVSLPSSVSNSVLLSSVSSPDDVPPLTFSNYFEINGVPYIRLRNQNLKRGDFVLGYPVEDISPDVVKYRGKYFKVEEFSK